MKFWGLAVVIVGIALIGVGGLPLAGATVVPCPNPIHFTTLSGTAIGTGTLVPAGPYGTFGTAQTIWNSPNTALGLAATYTIPSGLPPAGGFLITEFGSYSGPPIVVSGGGGSFVADNELVSTGGWKWSYGSDGSCSQNVVATTTSTSATTSLAPNSFTVVSATGGSTIALASITSNLLTSSGPKVIHYDVYSGTTLIQSNSHNRGWNPGETIADALVYSSALSVGSYSLNVYVTDPTAGTISNMLSIPITVGSTVNTAFIANSLSPGSVFTVTFNGQSLTSGPVPASSNSVSVLFSTPAGTYPYTTSGPASFIDGNPSGTSATSNIVAVTFTPTQVTTTSSTSISSMAVTTSTTTFLTTVTSTNPAGSTTTFVSTATSTTTGSSSPPPFSLGKVSPYSLIGIVLVIGGSYIQYRTSKETES